MPIYAFGPFVMDIRERRLIQDGRPVAVGGKTFEVLRLLVEAEGRLVDRETFNARLWPDVTVEDRNLTVHISHLRKALGGPASSVAYIETVSKTGYRIAVPVRPLPPATSDGRPPLPEAQVVLQQARASLDRAERVPALKALALFERVLALDPGSATAHAGLASTYLLLSSTTIRRPLPIDEAARLAEESARRALALDDRQAEARTVLGRLKMVRDWDWRGAEADLSEAVALCPESAEANEAHGWFLAAMGRHDAALEALARARRLDPLRRQTLEYLGLAGWMAGMPERGLEALTEASALDPEARRPHFRRMIVLDQLGRPDEAMAARITWLALFGEPAIAGRLAELERGEGHRAAMAEWIALLERLNQWFEAGLQWMVLDEPARALEALERCVAERSDQAPFLRQFPSLHPLAGQPRFERLVAALKLDGA